LAQWKTSYSNSIEMILIWRLKIGTSYYLQIHDWSSMWRLNLNQQPLHLGAVCGAVVL
jgi:hypothetical protein